jgi:hypothetical protein
MNSLIEFLDIIYHPVFYLNTMFWRLNSVSVFGRKKRPMDNVQKLNSCNFSLVAYVSFTAGTCLLSRCLAKIGGIQIEAHRLIGGIYEMRL